MFSGFTHQITRLLDESLHFPYSSGGSEDPKSLTDHRGVGVLQPAVKEEDSESSYNQVGVFLDSTSDMCSCSSHSFPMNTLQ